MKAATLVGLLLIVLGIGALAYQGASYRRQEEMIDVGFIEATAETIPIAPILGATAVIGGVALVFATTPYRDRATAA